MRIRSLVLVILTLGAALVAANARTSDAPASVTKQQMKRGKTVFHHICFSCHQLNGQGIPGVYPPLAKSNFIVNHRSRAIAALIHGMRGPVKVNGKTYNNIMPNLHLTNQQIADVFTYVSNSWGNSEGAVGRKLVVKKREALARSSPKSRSGNEQS